MDEESVKPLNELLDSVRNIDGFPIGKDEDIIALSDPPFYTACPNPYIKQFIEKHGKSYDSLTDTYLKEPFVGDVSEGKHHPIYTAHSYHTKVPHQAVQKFIEHYTKPGDIVFDGFCGTGMVGIAAVLSGRCAIVSEISTVATYIAYNLLNSIPPDKYTKEFQEILNEVKNECKWLYKTKHTKDAINKEKKGHQNFIDENEIEGDINYVVWNNVYKCNYCQNDICFGETQDDSKPGEFKEIFSCPFCHAELKENESKKVKVKIYDEFLKKEIEVIKQKPILISYSIGHNIFWKKPDSYDFYLIEKIEKSVIPFWVPIIHIPKGDKTIELYNKGIEYLHQLFTKRNLWTIAKFYDVANKKDRRYWFIINSLIQKSSKMMALNADYVGRVMKGTIYIPSLWQEINLFYFLEKNFTSFQKALDELKIINNTNIISTQSSTNLSNIPPNSVDYIFTDPPFGSNIMYSELNLIWEGFLRVITNNKHEAIINKTQNKELLDYTKLMEICFKEMYKILKPNRWITVEFHNSKASVWNGIQEALTRSGFIIAQVVVLDKKISSYNQINSPSGAVKNDLIINAYKPKKEFSERFLKNAGEGMEFDFITQQLEHLPHKPNIERTEKMLYSKMLAHYVENGFKIQYDATNFYKLLQDNFTELDGYWFSDTQIKDYNEWKSGLNLDQIKEIFDGQQVLFISDEKSALTWLYYFLHGPKSYSEIFTAYQQIATTKTDEIPEIREILDNNFILENGKYRRPLSQKEKEETNKTRERELDHAFNKLLEQAREQKGKIQNVRREAILHGFVKCYQANKYEDILTVADKLHSTIIESSGEIMDFVDIARIKTTGKKKIDEYQ
jgi:DNA modification methylase